MKKVNIFLLIAFIPCLGFSQSLTGLWTGALDKGTDPQRKDQSFELNLTEYRGKIYGYSYTTTLIHDTLFYIVKRVKGAIDGNTCEIKDAELISCNFMSQAEKDIKKTYSFHLDTNDSLWHLDGKWKTNKTKVFYSVTGDIRMSQEKDISKSKLLPHLQELNINDAVAVTPPVKKQPEPVNQPEKKEPPLAKAEPNENKDKSVAKQPLKDQDTGQVTANKSAAPASTSTNAAPDETAKTSREKATPKEKDTVKTETVAQTNSTSIKPSTEQDKLKEKNSDTRESAPAPIATAPLKKTELPAKPIAAAFVEKRKLETQQVVDFSNDSLTISLYDNGEIDGDTVSVLINGELIMANQGLKATAIKKTIYITPAMKDSFTLVLYAENLGKYPPNTGLMIVHDGDQMYQIRFSADLQKNVAVVFRRKKK